MSKFMQNLNFNLLSAISINTTGPYPQVNDLVQIAILPLNDSIDISKRYPPFIADLIPKRPENIVTKDMDINREELCKIVTGGIDPYKAAEYFVEWFEKLALPHGKKLMVLCHDWTKTYHFLWEWLGPKTFAMCFHYQVRDIVQLGTFANDHTSWLGNDYPYPKLNFRYFCSQLKIEVSKESDVIERARITAEIYKRQVKELR